MRVKRPTGRQINQFSATPRESKPNESPQGGGNAVDHTVNTPQATAGTARTVAAIWKKTPTLEGSSPALDAETFPGGLSLFIFGLRFARQGRRVSKASRHRMAGRASVECPD